MKKLMRSYILCLTVIILCISCTSCGGGGGGKQDFMDRFIPLISEYSSMDAWESWVMAAPLEGDDGNDHSFIARLIIARNGSRIVGFGNANGYPLGSFAISGTRTQDNIEFEIISQDRYRAYSLTGKGIYIKSDTQIGGNSLTGEDFSTVFDDPIAYDGNFLINVSQLETVKPDSIFEGRIDGAYSSIEDGSIKIKTSSDGFSLTIEELKGKLVGQSASEGEFSYTDPVIFGNPTIVANKFQSVGNSGSDSIEVTGSISGKFASGFVVLQKSGHVYMGAFSAITE